MPPTSRRPTTQRTNLVDSAVAALRARITSGEWAVGTRIPPEPALAQLLGVGRNTVREAVQSLVHAGLLDRRQGSGTYVLADDELAVTIGRQVAGAGHRDVLQVRRALEVEAARLAAARHTPAESQALRELLAARLSAWAAGDTDGMVTADVDLHVEIARIARNPVLFALYEKLLSAVVENIRFNVEGHSPRDAHGHDGLVEAIVAGDEAEAVREVEEYLAPLLGEGVPPA